MISDTEQRKDLPTRLKLRPEPVLTYANPAGGGQSHGEMFVWTRDGRPAIGPRGHAGFARFTNLPVSARHKDVRVWSFHESPAQGPTGGFDKRYYAVFGVDGPPITGAD